jgi:hypothetical protein
MSAFLYAPIQTGRTGRTIYQNSPACGYDDPIDRETHLIAIKKDFNSLANLAKCQMTSKLPPTMTRTGWTLRNITSIGAAELL